ncbi:cupin-like domain-containing protein [Sphingomonas oligoaromativorans]|uniref:cupin-like domain-containing protein n=1 Tax=Sphingomonas oligoaromativorans TaxID=575322 RepID=UPI00141ED281|nr:cupin-like domain-containing protein [Sphingomonas oligoaromativorans]NIJ32222.1 hypothetical protein [Sphingomonas oligoaromativorans]
MAMRAPREISVALIQSREAFMDEVVNGCEPVVLRQLCAAWPLVRIGNHPPAQADYLRHLDSGRPAEAFIGDPAISGRYFYGRRADGFNFARRTMRLSEALDAIIASGDPEEPSIYMGSLPVDSYLPDFAATHSIPVLPEWIVPRVWIGTQSTAACHYDTQDNLACVAAGQRRFTLYPPDAIGDLYVGPIDHTMAGQPISIAAQAPDPDQEFPRFEAARRRALTVDLDPGDALYLPKLWWHQVEATSSFNILVNYWWDAFSPGPDQPFTAMMLAMITLAERPAAERAAWRAFFDHYVFRPDGHPLAHMSEDQHGILGPLHPHNYRRLRAQIMQLLRGC